MTLGRAPDQGLIFNSTRCFCDERLSPTSIYRYLHDNSHRIFPDESFADLFKDNGRRSIPPRIVSVVMALQRLEGLSDREAVERFTFDLRWKYAAGGLDVEYPGFVHTVLVDMRARLRESERPNRIFGVVLEVAKAAGLVGRKRVLDSTPLYDAVATQDTVTMIRSALRGLLRVAPEKMEKQLRGALKRDDDYRKSGKPICDWDDAQARDTLIDALARDAYAALAQLEGVKLIEGVAEAAALLATVVGQDLEETGDGTFRIARRVAKNRVISTVDPEARHGHKSAARGFDGYKGHIALDPDSEIITATQVTPGNRSDGAVAEDLLAEVLPPRVDKESPTSPEAITVPAAETAAELAASDKTCADEPVEVYGDAAYGTAENLKNLDRPGVVLKLKVQGPSARKGKFSKDEFDIDMDGATVTCPNGERAAIRFAKDGSGLAEFGAACVDCPLRARCTESKSGRTIQLHSNERLLSQERAKQKDPSWQQDYKATRPKVERKLGHLMFRRHGGRCARMRGTERVNQDFSWLAAVANLKRLATLGIPAIQPQLAS